MNILFWIAWLVANMALIVLLTEFLALRVGMRIFRRFLGLSKFSVEIREEGGKKFCKLRISSPEGKAVIEKSVNAKILMATKTEIITAPTEGNYWRDPEEGEILSLKKS